MDSWNRLLAWAAYVVGGVIIGLGLYIGFQHYRIRGLAEAEGEPLRRGHPGTPVQVVQGIHPDQLFRQAAQIKRLQTLLKQKTELLERRTTLLDEKIGEQRQLESELDATLTAAESMALGSPEDLSNGGRDPRRMDESQRLRDEAEKNRLLADQRQQDLELLMLELAATDGEIERLQQESDLELVVLTVAREAFESQVATVLARIGQPAVPVLVEQLGHARADVRKWAAEMLGEIGAPAREALPSLAELLTDPEQPVRAAAEQALDRIDPPG